MAVHSYPYIRFFYQTPNHTLAGTIKHHEVRDQIDFHLMHSFPRRSPSHRREKNQKLLLCFSYTLEPDMLAIRPRFTPMFERRHRQFIQSLLKEPDPQPSQVPLLYYYGIYATISDGL